MTLDELLQNQNVSVTISAKDLEKFAHTVASETCRRIELSIANGQTESLLTIKEAAAKLGVSETTLWRWNKSEYLKNIEVGGERRYRISDIMRIINKKDK